MADAIHKLLESAASRHPNRAAIIGEESTLTYADLLRGSRQLATTLVSKGVTSGTPVGLCMTKSIDSIVAAYGIMMAGACYVPIDPTSPSPRALRITKNVGLTTVVTTADRVGSWVAELASSGDTITAILPTPPPGSVPVGVNTCCWYETASMVDNLPPSDGSTLAYVLHTSGSTGSPKGVAITHSNSLAFVEMAAKFFGVTKDDRLCSQAPLHFDLSIFDLFVAASAGAAVVLIPEYFSAFPRKMVDAIDQHQITIWNSVASAFTLMMEHGNPESATFDSLRLGIFSGEVMPAKYLRMMRDHMSGAELYNVYGQTEANSSIYYRIGEIPDNDTWLVPIGKPFPNFDVFALQDNGQIVNSVDQEGELYVNANTVAQGYWGNPEETSERFVSDPRPSEGGVRVYKTGDLVKLDGDGNFMFVGRRDDMVKSRGYRIELGDIEQALVSCPGVEFAVTIALPDELIGNKIVAFVSGDNDLTGDIVVSHCNQFLPPYMVPETVEIASELPRTSTGKIDRQSLRQTSLDKIAIARSSGL